MRSPARRQFATRRCSSSRETIFGLSAVVKDRTLVLNSDLGFRVEPRLQAGRSDLKKHAAFDRRGLMLASNRRRFIKRLQQFLLANRGGAALHNYDAARVVSPFRGFFFGWACSQGGGKRCRE